MNEIEWVERPSAAGAAPFHSTLRDDGAAVKLLVQARRICLREPSQGATINGPRLCGWREGISVAPETVDYFSSTIFLALVKPGVVRR